jgi:hypothetical protein
LVNLLAAGNDVRSLEFDDEVTDAIVLLVARSKVQVCPTTLTIAAPYGHNASVRQSLQFQVATEQFGQAAFADHEVIALSEDPEFMFENLVEVVTLTDVARVVRVKQQVLEAGQELVSARDQVGRTDDRG